MQTIKEFIQKHKITITSRYTDQNPADPSWQANHYICKLTRRTEDRKRKQFTIYFSKGYGLNGEPRADEVLNCVAMDSSHIENCPDFEDWAPDLGYDTDSRKAFNIFKRVLQ